MCTLLLALDHETGVRGIAKPLLLHSLDTLVPPWLLGAH
jgi:hypothetical protein